MPESARLTLDQKRALLILYHWQYDPFHSVTRPLFAEKDEWVLAEPLEQVPAYLVAAVWGCCYPPDDQRWMPALLALHKLGLVSEVKGTRPLLGRWTLGGGGYWDLSDACHNPYGIARDEQKPDHIDVTVEPHYPGTCDYDCDCELCDYERRQPPTWIIWEALVVFEWEDVPGARQHRGGKFELCDSPSYAISRDGLRLAVELLNSIDRALGWNSEEEERGQKDIPGERDRTAPEGLTVAGRARESVSPTDHDRPDNSTEQARQQAVEAHPDVNDDSHLSPRQLAETFNVPFNPLRCRLQRWRARNHEGWIEISDRKPKEAKYLYRVGSVRPIIDALKATSKTTSERPARKKRRSK